MTVFDDYKNRFRNIRFERQDGVLEVGLHTKGGPALWDGGVGGIHDQLGEAFALIGRDRETKVMILTGTGDAFCAGMDPDRIPEPMTPTTWERIYKEGKDLLTNLLEIDVPIIGAVNGPAFIHAELAVLSDIVIASDTARFADKVHAVYGVPPTDGVHVIWPMLLGPNRGRHFVWTGAAIDAEEALRIGLVAELHSPAALRERAWTLARDLAKKPTLMLRYTRTALTLPFKRALLTDLGYGLALEGLAVLGMSEG